MEKRGRKQPEKSKKKTVLQVSSQDAAIRGTVRMPDGTVQPKITGPADGKVFWGIPARKGYNIYENEIATENLAGDLPSADLQDLI